MENYLVGIGKRIKELRKKNKLTIHTVATKAAVSNGLISRIENGRTMPSLPVLLSIIQALDVEISEFFNALPSLTQSSYVVTRKADYSLVEKEEEAEGFEYRAIFGKSLSAMAFDTVLLTIQPGSKREKVETDAFEFKYVISGECYYIIGEEEVLVAEGDSIFFDGRIPHVPENRSAAPCVMLVLYFFITKNE